MTTINATLRDRAGKGTARATRRAGNIPVVIYGNKQPPVMLAVNAKEMEIISRKPGFFTQLFEVKAARIPGRPSPATRSAIRLPKCLSMSTSCALIRRPA